jgi:hypothetical protein
MYETLTATVDLRLFKMESGSTVAARSTRSSAFLAGAAKPAEAKRGRARSNLLKSMARGVSL